MDISRELTPILMWNATLKKHTLLQVYVKRNNVCIHAEMVRLIQTLKVMQHYSLFIFIPQN